VPIVEEGPREGFHFERQAVPTARKIELLEALAETGLGTNQTVSFVDPGGCRVGRCGCGGGRAAAARGRGVHSALAEREGAPAGARAPRPAGALRLSVTFMRRDQNRGFADNAAIQGREIETCWRTACRSRGSR
jgi:hydroxymethylglutaryl-CoA lyase